MDIEPSEASRERFAFICNDPRNGMNFILADDVSIARN